MFLGLVSWLVRAPLVSFTSMLDLTGVVSFQWILVGSQRSVKASDHIALVWVVMARKGKEADVQVYVKTEEEWEKLVESQVQIFGCYLVLYCYKSGQNYVQGTYQYIQFHRS